MSIIKKYHWEDDFKSILKTLSEYYKPSSEEKKQLKKAFEFSEKIHQGEHVNGHKTVPYIVHPIRATKILMEVQPDLPTIIATILHGILLRTEITRQEVEQNFGSDVAFLCEKMEKLWSFILKPSHGHDDYLKKLLLAMAEDIRVIYIQLSDIIDNLQHKCFKDLDDQKSFCENGLHIFGPMAAKLNLYHFKQQIEDYSFKIIHPEIYERIKQEVNANRTQRKNVIEKSIKDLEEALKEENIPFDIIYGRPKNFYSIYLKMKRKSYASVKDVYDLFALRIVTNKESNCYRTLGAIHARWKPLPDRFKDYIAIPKVNGYQSLHTTILGLGESISPTEVQIKTKDMEHAAEFGSAAHWAYKKRKGSNFDKDFLDQHEWLPSSKVQNDNQSDQDFHQLSQEIFAERIHVFTPKGEIKHLPKDATPVDFAYNIHSQVGDHMIGAKVNGRIKPLDHKLKPGDVVDILTKSGRKPNPLWLNFVKSSQAKSKIKSYLNKLEKAQEVGKYEKGKKLIEEIPITREKTPKTKSISSNLPHDEHKSPIVIGGTKTKSYKLPKCCKPKAPQTIIAYNSRGLEFTIHRTSCKMLEYLEDERILEAHFIKHFKFQIQATERTGLLTEITDCIVQNNINTLSCSHKVKQKDKVEFNFEIEYIDESEITRLFELLALITNVETITKCEPTKKKTAKKS